MDGVVLPIVTKPEDRCSDGERNQRKPGEMKESQKATQVLLPHNTVLKYLGAGMGQRPAGEALKVCLAQWDLTSSGDFT